MKEILNIPLTPNKPCNDNKDLFVFIDRISKDNELFKKFITELIDKYTRMMDQKSALQDSKIAQISSKVTVQLEYIEDAEGLKIE